MDRKKLIQAVTAFKSNDDKREGLQELLYDAENKRIVSSDGRRMIIARSLFEEKYSENCRLDENLFKRGHLVKSGETTFPDYKEIIPSVPNMEDFISMEVPDWLKDHAKRATRADIPAVMDRDWKLSLSVNIGENYLDLALLAPLHGENVRAFFVKRSVLIEPERDGYGEPEWFVVIALKKMF